MRRIIILLSLICLALLSACSSTASTGNSSTSATPTTSSSATSTAVQATPTTTNHQASIAPTSIALEYYKALQDKNYTKAYSYLDTSAATTQGQKLGQTAFTTLAQTQDQEWGPIQSYDALGDTSDPTMVIMTVSRTRNERYHSHLTVKNGKIILIDNI
ncbi:MAG TPA: hypothetical protein VFN23_19890 [Ktedonobacteraceae bacterium]|nr:hypothetical protein [Ktedonobacteraceae bacterium]